MLVASMKSPATPRRAPFVRTLTFLACLACLAACAGTAYNYPQAWIDRQPAFVVPAADELWIVVRSEERAAPWTADELAEAGLVARTSSGASVRLALAELSIEVDVLGRLAAVTARQVYANPSFDAVNVELVWPLPAHGAVTGFVLEAGQRRIRGVVRERREAERMYAAARRQGRLATLVAAEDAFFRQRFANLPKQTPIALTLEYFHDLPWVDGWCELDLPLIGSTSCTLSLEVRLDATVAVDALELEGLDVGVERVDAGRALVQHRGRSPGRPARLRYHVDDRYAQSSLLVQRAAEGAYFCLVAYPPRSMTAAAAGELVVDWNGLQPEAVFVPGGRAGGAPVVMLGRLGSVNVEPPLLRWVDEAEPSSVFENARWVDVPDGPIARALPKAWARLRLAELRAEVLAGLGEEQAAERVRAFRELALEYGLVTFFTALAMVDARSR